MYESSSKAAEVDRARHQIELSSVTVVTFLNRAEGEKHHMQIGGILLDFILRASIRVDGIYLNYFVVNRLLLVLAQLN
jgi:hypothetical protein